MLEQSRVNACIGIVVAEFVKGRGARYGFKLGVFKDPKRHFAVEVEISGMGEHQRQASQLQRCRMTAGGQWRIKNDRRASWARFLGKGGIVPRSWAIRAFPDLFGYSALPRIPNPAQSGLSC